MTTSTERLRVYGAVNLLEWHGFEPPSRYGGNVRAWLIDGVRAGALACHDHTGLRIEPEHCPDSLGVLDETTSIQHLNSWLASIGHLRRVPCEDAPAPEPASAPSTGRIDDALIDAALKGMSEAGLRELRAMLELMRREEGIQRQIPPTHILEAAERVRRVCGPTPVASQAPAPSEHTSAPAVAPTPAPSASTPAAAAPEPAQKQKKRPRRSWWDDIVGYLAEVWRKWKGGTGKEFYKELESRAGSPDSPLEKTRDGLKVRGRKQSIAMHTMETRMKWVRAAAGMP